MKRTKPIDPDNPPTRRSDWVGAELLKRGERHGVRTGTTEFHVFRASNDNDLFLVTDQKSSKSLPSCPRGGQWAAFKVIPMTGRPRVGFDEADAKRDIARRGYHLVQLGTRRWQMV